MCGTEDIIQKSGRKIIKTFSKISVCKLFFIQYRYTNHYDWPIRKILDEAEEHIAQDYGKAIEAFHKVLKDYPDSPRANYLLIRVQEMKLDNSTDDKDLKSEAYKKEVLQILDK